jgi:hypothetical protein
MSELQLHHHESITTPGIATPGIAESSLTSLVDDPIFHLELMFKMDDAFVLVLRSFRDTISRHMYLDTRARPIRTTSAARITRMDPFMQQLIFQQPNLIQLYKTLGDLADDVETLVSLRSHNTEPLVYNFYNCKWLIARFFVDVANLKVYEETTAWLLDEEIQMMKLDDLPMSEIARDLETEHMNFANILTTFRG